MSGELPTFDPVGRAQFVSDIGKRIEQLDACGDSPLSWGDATNALQRTLGRLNFAAEENDYFDARRHALTMVALLYITARDRNILTDHAAVAATDAAK